MRNVKRNIVKELSSKFFYIFRSKFVNNVVEEFQELNRNSKISKQESFIFFEKQFVKKLYIYNYRYIRVKLNL